MLDSNNKKSMIFIHKKILMDSVYGVKGYKSTIIWEDNFENGITDETIFII